MKFKTNVKKNPIRNKLISSLIMVVVSACMVVSSTYAWFVMSTAPEVSNIKTQIGANGALEVALLNKESWADLSLLDVSDFDESAVVTLSSANLTWGNLVNLGDAVYGMDKIILQPSRLNIAQNGTDESGNLLYKINSTFLKTPVYGVDGRIQSLDSTSAVAYTYSGTGFSVTDGYGVRAIGTSATMNEYQLGMTAARSQLVSYISSARTKASTTLNSTGSGLANIVVQYGVSNKVDGYTTTDIQAIKDLGTGLKASLDDIELALRQVFYGYITTEDSGVSSDNLAAAIAETQDASVTLSSLLAKYPGIAILIPDIGSYITKLNNDLNTVNNSITTCDGYITAGGTYTWAQISGLISPLCDTDAMKVGNQSIDELKASLKNPDGSINMEAAINLVSGGITISVPSGSGVLSDISDFAGNYTAKVTIENVSAAGQTIPSMTATMQTATTANPVYLTHCGNLLRGATVSSAGGNASITDYYGYAIDLAFRSNAEESNLLLQTESENRVYQGDTANAALQGGGSYMRFTTSAGISCTKMVSLMKGIRIVFIDEEQNVLSIAALDCTLGKDAYTTLDADDEHGNYAYLDGSSRNYQISDGITFEEYNLLPDESSVVFDKTTDTVTAKIYLHTFEMTKSDTSTLDNTKYTGGVTLNAKRNDSVITSLEQDVAKKVTAVVYLDGSYVTNAMVAADSAQSMVGTLNLQFASDATLIPAENNTLRSGS